MLPSPKCDGFGVQHRHRCEYFFKLSGPIILRCFLRQPIIANNYFTIITIIGPTINRSDASLKSTERKQRKRRKKKKRNRRTGWNLKIQRKHVLSLDQVPFSNLKKSTYFLWILCTVDRYGAQLKKSVGVKIKECCEKEQFLLNGFHNSNCERGEREQYKGQHSNSTSRDVGALRKWSGWSLKHYPSIISNFSHFSGQSSL